MTFYIAGAGILISGLMLTGIPWLEKCDKTSNMTSISVPSECQEDPETSDNEDNVDNTSLIISECETVV